MKFRLTFHQRRTPEENEPLGEALSEAIRQGLEQVVESENINREQYSLLLAIHSNSFTNGWAQSARHVPLNERLHNQDYARTYLEDLARKLNSAQVVDPERDGCYVELTFVKTLGRAGNNGGGRGTWKSEKDGLGEAGQKEKMHLTHPKQRQLVLCEGHRYPKEIS